MLAVAMLVFAAVFAAVLGLYLWVNAARNSPTFFLKRRLRTMADPDDGYEASMKQLLRQETAAEQFVYRLPLLGKLKNLVEKSGVQVEPVRLILSIAGASLLLFTVTYLWREDVLISLVAAFVALAAALISLNIRKKKWEEKFTEQLPDALSIIARSLRAGHSLTGAVELVGQELPEPSRSLFKLAYDQQKLGMRMSDSLGTLLDKIDSLDLHFLVTIVRINSDAGGNLAEILDKLAETVRSRLQIRRQVQVVTAEGRLSGYVLVLLPVAVFIGFHLLRPEYMSVFFHEKICQMWLFGAVVAQIIGFLFIKRIVNIRI